MLIEYKFILCLVEIVWLLCGLVLKSLFNSVFDMIGIAWYLMFVFIYFFMVLE